MSVKTTLNVNKKIMEQVNEAAEFIGKSRSEIIILLLMKVMENDTSGAMPSGPVKYQNKDEEDEWHKFHISFREDYYDYFTDLRKFLKSSLSRLVAYAVKKYLYKLMNSKSSDNTIFQNYIIAKESANGVQFWKILWGLPKDVEKFIQIS